MMRSRRRGLTAAALALTVLTTSAGVATSLGATVSKTGTHQLRAELRFVSELGDCPSGMTALVCAARAGDGRVAGLGNVDETYTQILDVLRGAATVDGPVPFTEPVLDALRRLVPCDVVAYHERPHPKAGRAIGWRGEPRGPVTPEVAAAQRRLENQDPLPPSPGARKFSDLFSRAEYHRLELYQEVSRPLGVEDMFRLWLDPHGEAEARLEFDRPDRRFRERDRDVLDLLRPHFEQFRRNALRRRSVRSDGAESLTPRELEILDLVAEGCTNAEVARILWISARTVNKHLENAYEKLGVHTRTGAVAAIRRASRARAG